MPKNINEYQCRIVGELSLFSINREGGDLFTALVLIHFVIGFCLGVYLPMTISLALRNLQQNVWLIVMAAYSLRVSLGMDAGSEFQDLLLKFLAGNGCIGSVLVLPV